MRRLVALAVASALLALLVGATHQHAEAAASCPDPGLRVPPSGGAGNCLACRLAHPQLSEPASPTQEPVLGAAFRLSPAPESLLLPSHAAAPLRPRAPPTA